MRLSIDNFDYGVGVAGISEQFECAASWSSILRAERDDMIVEAGSNSPAVKFKRGYSS
jgi:hypothetical protein